MRALTLSVHEIRDGDRVVALNLGNHGVEGGAGMAWAWAQTHVLLAEMLKLGVDGNRLLVTR
jgi:hypothetical protein